MHFVWNKNSNEFRGVNSFGIRLRHECFDRWLREARTIQYVLMHLGQANFDPEFFSRYETEITSDFIEKHPAFKMEVNT
jgi:NADH oxidase (H2O2-forming)